MALAKIYRTITKFYDTLALKNEHNKLSTTNDIVMAIKIYYMRQQAILANVYTLFTDFVNNL